MTKEQFFGCYLGQKILLLDSFISYKKGKNYILTPYVLGRLLGRTKANDCKTKLILRPLSEMTEEENKIRTGLMINDDGIEYDTFESTEYLLEKGFDIFDLHSRGWAVYESELKGEKK